jgi:monoamine oxidase
MSALLYWKEIALGLALCVCGAFFSLWRHEVSAHAQYRAEVVAIAQAQEAHAKAITEEQRKITDETANAWAKNLDYVRRYYADRLRQSGSGQMPGISQPTRSLDAIPEDALPIASECGETTLQLIELQGWIRQQQGVK